MRQFVAVATLLVLIGFQAFSQNEITVVLQPESCINSTEKEVARLINQYRATKGLPAIALSKSLSLVARTHAMDQTQNHKYNNSCNLHSWGESEKWSSCCYTADHKQAQCMWDKPRELTTYKGDGFEISYFSTFNYPTPEAFAKDALEGWKKSAGHNSIIINANIWKNIKWLAMGVGVYGDYINVWFGREEDPAGNPSCFE